ncbi:MAG: ABC transporter substrate-binding protein, partial [Acinetobacter sp.]
MIKKALMSVSVLSAILLSGCDNTAKVPEPNAKAEGTVNTQPIRIGYSDWPGWVAWQVAIEKGWLEEAGVNADFKWFDYSASLSAFAANQLD